LVVADRTAHHPAVMWEPSSAAEHSPVMRVAGRISDHPRYGRQVIISEVQAADPGSTELRSLLAGPQEPVDELVSRLDTLLDAIEDEWLRSLLDGLIGSDGALPVGVDGLASIHRLALGRAGLRVVGAVGER